MSLKYDMSINLLSRLWSRSPSRQTVSPTNRMVSTTPNAWLRLSRGSVLLSPPADLSSTVLSFVEEKKFFQIHPF